MLVLILVKENFVTRRVFFFGEAVKFREKEKEREKLRSVRAQGFDHSVIEGFKIQNKILQINK